MENNKKIIVALLLLSFVGTSFAPHTHGGPPSFVRGLTEPNKPENYEARRYLLDQIAEGRLPEDRYVRPKKLAVQDLLNHPKEELRSLKISAKMGALMKSLWSSFTSGFESFKASFSRLKKKYTEYNLKDYAEAIVRISDEPVSARQQLAALDALQKTQSDYKDLAEGGRDFNQNLRESINKDINDARRSTCAMVIDEMSPMFLDGNNHQSVEDIKDFIEEVKEYDVEFLSEQEKQTIVDYAQAQINHIEEHQSAFNQNDPFINQSDRAAINTDEEVDDMAPEIDDETGNEVEKFQTTIDDIVNNSSLSAEQKYMDLNDLYDDLYDTDKYHLNDEELKAIEELLDKNITIQENISDQESQTQQQQEQDAAARADRIAVEEEAEKTYEEHEKAAEEARRAAEHGEAHH